MTSIGIELPIAFRPVTFDSAGGAANQNLATGRILLGGWVFANTDDANPAELFVFDGQDSGGVRVGYQHNSGGGTMNYTAPDPGILCEAGLTVQCTAGTVRGALYIVYLT